MIFNIFFEFFLLLRSEMKNKAWDRRTISNHLYFFEFFAKPGKKIVKISMHVWCTVPIGYLFSLLAKKKQRNRISFLLFIQCDLLLWQQVSSPWFAFGFCSSLFVCWISVCTFSEFWWIQGNMRLCVRFIMHDTKNEMVVHQMKIHTV